VLYVEIGTTVYSRGRRKKGHTVSAGRPCSLEGCRGWRLSVRWSKTSLTYPCTKGMQENADGSWTIL